LPNGTALDSSPTPWRIRDGRNKYESRHVGLDFFDLLIEALIEVGWQLVSIMPIYALSDLLTFHRALKTLAASSIAWCFVI
jgi:hypothetical protein